MNSERAKLQNPAFGPSYFANTYWYRPAVGQRSMIGWMSFTGRPGESRLSGSRLGTVAVVHHTK